MAFPSRFVLAQRAAAMRHAPTSSERLLWSRLNAGQLGVTFRRQYVIGRFIADFAAPGVRLVVELDGGCHADRGARDARRDRELGQAGWRVMRLPADLVLARLDDAVALVRAALVR